MMDPQSREYRLLGILQEHAPNGRAQDVCSKMVNEAIADGATAKELELLICSALIDGLRHGNWVWLMRIRWVQVSPEDLELHHEYVIPCMRCNAPAQRYCMSKYDTQMQSPHLQRKNDYRDLQS